MISAEKVDKLEADKKVKVTATVEGKEVSKVDVTVKPAAALKEVKATAKTTQVAQGASTVVRVVPTDQYGNVVAELVKDTNITLATGSSFEIPSSGVKAVEEGDKTVGYDVTIKTVDEVKPGKSTVEFKVTKDDATASAKVDFTVVEAIEAIGSVEIKEVEGLQNAAPEDGVKLEAIVKDKDDQVLEVTTDDLKWSITGVKDAKGNALTLTEDPAGTYKVTLADKEEVTLTITDGVLKTGGSESLKGLTIDVAVQVETANFKTAETTVTITDEALAYKEGFKIEKAFEGKVTDATKAKEVKVENNTIEITDEATQAVTLTFTGTDQYGDIFGITEGVTADKTSSLATEAGDKLSITLADDTKLEDLQTITITSTTGEDGEVYISYGKERLVLNVKVSASVKAIAEAKAAIKALPAADAVTVADAAAIQAARDAFDKLTSDQQKKVTATKLTDAETALGKVKTAKGNLETAINTVSFTLKGETVAAGDTITIGDNVYLVVANETNVGAVDKDVKYATVDQATTLFNAIKAAKLVAEATDKTETQYKAEQDKLDKVEVTKGAIVVFTEAVEAQVGTK
ncbi:hypothetical protein [Metalysinibacillus jejuensis]|uniref:hypothetical protein n=1 Tax=Metalysinibacillus jejuensis TaxID=914327 RepID=UPI000D348C0C|nr:hypothetical protein [Metalysinibacillus jejuensis]